MSAQICCIQWGWTVIERRRESDKDTGRRRGTQCHARAQYDTRTLNVEHLNIGKVRADRIGEALFETALKHGRRVSNCISGTANSSSTMRVMHDQKYHLTSSQRTWRLTKNGDLSCQQILMLDVVKPREVRAIRCDRHQACPLRHRDCVPS